MEVANVRDFEKRKILKTEVDSRTYLVVEDGGEYYALENRCPHLGMPLARGKIEDGQIVCPWHGSRFKICTGENVDWVNAFAGIPMPKWSHRFLELGRKPAPIESIKLVRFGDSICWPTPEQRTGSARS